MIQIIKKKLEISLLFALSLTLATTAHAAIDATEALTSHAMKNYNSMQKRYMMAPIAKPASLKRLVTDLTKLDLQQIKKLIFNILDLAANKNPKTVMEVYKNRFAPSTLETMTKMGIRIFPKYERLKLQGDMQEYYNQQLGIYDFFRYLALVPPTQKRAVNRMLRNYDISPIK